MPRSSLSRRNSAMTSSDDAVSSAPVGSSARISCGSFTSERAIATRCCCPPESWLGWCCAYLREPDRVERFQRRAAPLGRRHAGVDHRQLDVLERRRSRQQVVALEHEAEPRLRRSASASSSSVGDVVAVEAVVARRRPVEKADDVHEGRLARARRSHDGDELAGLDRQVDAAQRDDVGSSLERVDLAQPAHLDDGRIASASAARRRRRRRASRVAGGRCCACWRSSTRLSRGCRR